MVALLSFGGATSSEIIATDVLKHLVHHAQRTCCLEIICCIIYVYFIYVYLLFYFFILCKIIFITTWVESVVGAKCSVVIEHMN